jgi:hypothetical protein
MLKLARVIFTAALGMALAVFAPGSVLAQAKGGKIICWKDKSGKVVGCGDKVPPEFEDAATKELDRRGVTRATTDTAEERAKRAAQEEAVAKQKEEERKRFAEQRRRDQALLNTYANDREIDQRRDREMAEIDRVIGQFQGLRKSAETRRTTALGHIAEAEKSGKKPSDFLKDEVARAESDMDRVDKSIAAKNKEKEDIRVRYAETKKRYLELGGTPAQAAAAPRK